MSSCVINKQEYIKAGGFFAGLALDDDNEPGETADRIDRWCEQLRREAAL